MKADWRLVPAGLYVALLGLLVGSAYEVERSPEPNVVVDWFGALFLLGLLTFIVGVVIGRWWALLLPLIAFQFAVLAIFVAALDTGYTGERSEILTVATIFILFFGIPSMVAGVGFWKLGALAIRALFRRARTD